MERVVSDRDSITWTCTQAFSGLSDQTEHPEAAQIKGETAKCWVVCTPSGGAQSVRLKLANDWETAYSDEELLHEIEKQSNQQSV